MPLHAGDTFHDAQGIHDKHRHLFFVISDPDTFPNDPILIVNCTSSQYRCDSTCILIPGEHPFIRTESWVYYKEANLADPAMFQQALSNALLMPNQSLSVELLDRIRNGAIRSDNTPEVCKELLLRHCPDLQ